MCFIIFIGVISARKHRLFDTIIKALLQGGVTESVLVNEIFVRYVSKSVQFVVQDKSKERPLGGASYDVM